MDDKLKVFWNLDVLVKMCRSKSDGPSLRIEEEDIVEKIDAYKQEIEEIKTQSEEDSYDSSAEMADRNIEIITKKQLQTLKANLKDKNKELNLLKEEELSLYSNNSLLRDNKLSQERYIASMQERINEATDYEVIDRYNGLIAETTEKISQLVDDLEEHNDAYEKIQQSILNLSDEIAIIEDKINKKKKLLSETQANLEHRENYIDKVKKEKTDKKIAELELKVQKSTARLDEIRKDPCYLESKIKDVINDKDDIENARPYLISLINTAIKVPYINVPADNTLEEELLRATQARDSFANEIEQKSYNILEANTPEKIRIEFLNERISLWSNELEELKTKVDIIDRDKEYNYEVKNRAIHEMIQSMKKDLREYQKAYADLPEMNIAAKANMKAAMDEKKADILEAEKIVTAFRKDESDDIERATRAIKYDCERLYQSIQLAEKEIESIKNRLTSKKSGLIDISTKNKDKDILKELAQIVIDIKHRRQFPETPLEIVKRLEEELNIKLINEIDNSHIENTSNIVKNNYEEYNDFKKETKRGIKVIKETEVETNIETNDESAADATKLQEAEAELKSLISDIEEKEKNNAKELIEKADDEDGEDTEAGGLNTPIESIEELSSPVIEEPIPVVEETPIVVEAPVVEEPTPVIEETPVVVEAPVIEEPTPVIGLVPTNEQEIDIEQLPVEMPLQTTEEDDEMLDQQIDSIISSTAEETEDNQTLDIDAMFADTNVVTETPKIESKKLSIDKIFNVETDDINSNDTSNENLANDFDQYISELEKKEA